ncbi:hypothetical protein Ga0609869_000819 [Rhodovulum iodosum]|uniref:Uncharacterized protein n=1 Tax=Rhodovulum iodosum TaxID=68291 RepID=A0ABV3XQ65_9RHOB|nr:hypothetical protein [Rhodovulum robiginosum]RSK31264.1 hypothetical protein EJA01_14010 [Rhodovulum robiginosum]
MPTSLATAFTAILLAGALFAGAAQQPVWVIVVIAAFATIANVMAPNARAARAAEGKGLVKALPMIVINQLIWVNLVYLAGYGVAWLLGGPVFAAPVWLSLGVSAVGFAGAVATALKG